MAQFSRWVTIPLLVDGEEMGSLFEAVGNPLLFHAKGVVPRGGAEISIKEFIESYLVYVQDITSAPPHCFTAYLSASRAELNVVEVGEDKELVRPVAPVIHLRPHRLAHSLDDGQFRSNVAGERSVAWGIQIAYPGLYQNPKTEEIIKVGPEFVNTALFKKMQRWVRHHTRATPFVVEGKRTNVPVRLGLNCFAWINKHPDLMRLGIEVAHED